MKTFNRLFTIIEYLLFIAATVMVITFQFLPYQFLIIGAITLYVIGFLSVFVHSLVETIYFFAISRRVSAEDSALVASGKVEVMKSRSQKVIKILLTILWFALFVFALTVLIFYVKKL